jgi:hypothetical protein
MTYSTFKLKTRSVFATRVLTPGAGIKTLKAMHLSYDNIWGTNWYSDEEKRDVGPTISKLIKNIGISKGSGLRSHLINIAFNQVADS